MDAIEKAKMLRVELDGLREMLNERRIDCESLEEQKSRAKSELTVLCAKFLRDQLDIDAGVERGYGDLIRIGSSQ